MWEAMRESSDDGCVIHKDDLIVVNFGNNYDNILSDKEMVVAKAYVDFLLLTFI
jgi:hypothetical protein